MNKNTSNNDEIDLIDEDEFDEPKKLTKEQIKQLTSLVTVTRRKTNEVIRLCPHCVFSAVKIIPSYANFMIPSRFFCPKCDWQGPIAIEATVADLEQYLKDNPISETDNSETESSGFCVNCGKELETGEEFCPSCGKERS
jgi:predicted RNA-binding Zn-ribbon protein involved in translation (DUF1610 family)